MIKKLTQSLKSILVLAFGDFGDDNSVKLPPLCVTNMILAMMMTMTMMTMMLMSTTMLVMMMVAMTMQVGATPPPCH